MVKNDLIISSSLEDYLEGIFVIKQKKKTVRVKDLAKHLRVRAPSVVEMLKKLEEKDLIVHEHYGYIELTNKGINKAKILYKRHLMIKKFLQRVLGIDEVIAETDACRIEHYLSKETLVRIIKFIDFIETCPQGVPEWLNNFYYFIKHKKRPTECKAKFLGKREPDKKVASVNR